jgi:hypothetical protein
MTPLNLRVTDRADGFLVTADSRRPAPEFAALLHSLAHPDKYQGSTDPVYRAAVDRIDAAFGKGKA